MKERPLLLFSKKQIEKKSRREKDMNAMMKIILYKK